MPWPGIGTHVIILKHGSPFKGYVGIVKDVVCGQDTASSLKIIMQLVYHNPSAPFWTMPVDYDDIIEQM